MPKKGKGKGKKGRGKKGKKKGTGGFVSQAALDKLTKVVENAKMSDIGKIDEALNRKTQYLNLLKELNDRALTKATVDARRRKATKVRQALEFQKYGSSQQEKTAADYLY